MQIDGVGKGVAAGIDLANKSREKGAARAESPRDQGDQVSLHGRPRWAQALVQQALQFSLEINGGHYQAPKQTEEVTPDTLFDFEEVAKNVLSFVTGRLGAARADGKGDDELGTMMEQARKGVDMGFEQARKMLGDLATDNEDIKTGIDQSYKLIQEGLDQFEKEFFGQVSATDMAAAQLASRQQGSLEIETRDGDKVVLRFNDSWQFQASSSDQGSKVSFQYSQSFSFSLQGNLSEAETGAIGQLIKGLDTLAHSFFSGNLDTLPDQLGDLQLDDSQLASFSLKVKQQSRVNLAYQGDHSLQDLLKPLADYLPKLQQWQSQADEALPPPSQQSLTQSVLMAQGRDQEQRQRFNGFNQRMLDALHLMG